MAPDISDRLAWNSYIPVFVYVNHSSIIFRSSWFGLACNTWARIGFVLGLTWSLLGLGLGMPYLGIFVGLGLFVGLVCRYFVLSVFSISCTFSLF